MAGNLDPAEIAIRPSRPEDRDALVELDLASAAHHVAIDPEVYRMPERDAVALFLDRRLASADREVLVAVVGGAVVGRVDLTMLEPPDDGSIVRCWVAHRSAHLSAPNLTLAAYAGPPVPERDRGAGVADPTGSEP